MQFTERETATILAALRQWQKAPAWEFNDIATNGERYKVLSDGEIGKLCERINTAPNEIWALCSDDDGVVLCNTEKDAAKALRAWKRAAANNARGPFGPFKA